MFIVSQPRAQSVTPDHNYRPRRVGLLLLDPLFCKQFQVNRIAHDLATLIRRVQMIAAIGGPQKKRKDFSLPRSRHQNNTHNKTSPRTHPILLVLTLPFPPPPTPSPPLHPPQYS